MSGEIKVQLDRAHLTARMSRGKEQCGPALAEQILHNCEEFVPKWAGSEQSGGYLRMSGEPKPYEGEYSVQWDTVYAAYQFYGCWPDGSHAVKNHTTPGTETHWTEHARNKYKDTWDTVAQREFVKGAKS